MSQNNVDFDTLARSATTLTLSLAACSPSVPFGAKPAPADASPASVADTAHRTEEPPPPPPIPWLGALALPVCSVSAPTWSGELRLRPAGEPFATISRAPASLLLGGAANGGESQAAIASARLRVLGVVDRPTLYLARPTLLSQVVVPRASTPVTWFETTTPDRVGVSLDVSDTFEVPTMAEAVVPCSALTGTEPAFDARAFAAPPARKTATVRGDETLLASIGDRSGARLNSARGSRVDIVDRRGEMTRVVIEHHRYWAVGWLPTTALSQSHVSRVPQVRMGTAQTRVEAAGQRCAHDIALIASVGGERAFVGTLGAGGLFSATTVDVEPGFVELKLFEPWFNVLSDAKLLARADDVRGC